MKDDILYEEVDISKVDANTEEIKLKIKEIKKYEEKANVAGDLVIDALLETIACIIIMILTSKIFADDEVMRYIFYTLMSLGTLLGIWDLTEKESIKNASEMMANHLKEEVIELNNKSK